MNSTRLARYPERELVEGFLAAHAQKDILTQQMWDDYVKEQGKEILFQDVIMYFRRGPWLMRKISISIPRAEFVALTQHVEKPMQVHNPNEMGLELCSGRILFTSDTSRRYFSYRRFEPDQSVLFRVSDIITFAQRPKERKEVLDFLHECHSEVLQDAHIHSVGLDGYEQWVTYTGLTQVIRLSFLDIEKIPLNELYDACFKMFKHDSLMIEEMDKSRLSTEDDCSGLKSGTIIAKEKKIRYIVKDGTVFFAFLDIVTSVSNRKERTCREIMNRLNRTTQWDRYVFDQSFLYQFPESRAHRHVTIPFEGVCLCIELMKETHHADHAKITLNVITDKFPELGKP